MKKASSNVRPRSLTVPFPSLSAPESISTYGKEYC